MSHHVVAYVACEETFRATGIRTPLPIVFRLDGVGLLPLTHELMDEVGGRRTGVGDDPVVLALSKAGPVVGVETDYFVGAAEQSAAVARDGVVVHGPDTARGGVINEALRRVGVAAPPGVADEFEAVGLARYRDNEDVVRGFYRSVFRAGFSTVPASICDELFRVASEGERREIGRGDSGLVSCPDAVAPDHPVAALLRDHGSDGAPLELAEHDHWMITRFFEMRRDVAIAPDEKAELSTRIADRCDLTISIWSAVEAARIADGLVADDDAVKEFRTFYPYHIHGAGPTEELAEAFAARVAWLRERFVSTNPDAVLVRVEV